VGASVHEERGGRRRHGMGGGVAILTQQEVGGRLRCIRQRKRLSLYEVEELSSEEFKASVLGAYERDERVISVPRLLRLAQVYGVAAEELLPKEVEVDRTESGVMNRCEGFAVDLGRLREWPGWWPASRPSAETSTAGSSAFGPTTCERWRASSSAIPKISVAA